MYISEGVLCDFVAESNRIEGETAFPGDMLFKSHLEIAQKIAMKSRRVQFMHPNTIHYRLCRGTEMEKIGGLYRTIDCYFGSKQMPEPAQVPLLMGIWWKETQKYFHENNMSGEEAAQRAENLTYDLLAIHPYQDGNGRTSRLLHNMLRLRHGLHWLTVKDRRRFRYFERIRLREAEFKTRFPHVYFNPASP